MTPGHQQGGGLSAWRGRLEIVALVVFISLGLVMIWKLALKDTGIASTARVAGRQTAIKPPPPPPPRLPVDPISIAGAVLKGTPSAPVAIVEYSDFECPYCATFVKTTLADLDREYIVTGRVLFAFRHLPLESIHKRAFRAAEASECANRQGRFWDFHDTLFQNPKEMDEPSLGRRAADLGLNVSAFSACLDGQATDKVRQDVGEAGRLGVRGTPTFFIGVTGPDGLVTVTDRISGARPLSAFKEAIDKAMAAASAETR